MATCVYCPRTIADGERYCRFHKSAANRWLPLWTRRQRYTIAAVSALLILPALAYRWDHTLASVVIYWLTALIVLWYTYETYGMRVEMIKQNEIAIQPLLILSIEPSSAQEHEHKSDIDSRQGVLTIRNIGRGPAIFVEIAEIQIAADDSRESYVVRFETADHLEPGKSAVATAGFFSKDGTKLTRHFNFLSSLNPKYAHDKVEVVLRYEDVDQRARFSVMQMGKPGIRLLQTDRGRP